ncbi:MAG: PAS domain-containing sensor histidine kinase [Candidatus Methylomirabilia bacterium]
MKKRRDQETSKAPRANQDALSPEAVQRLVHELEVHQIELKTQNEELRRAQADLEASRDRYLDLFDLAPVGYLTLSETGVIREANLTAAALLGEARGALPKQPLARFVARGDQDAFYLHCKQLFATGKPQVFETELARDAAAPITARVEMAAGRGAEGEPVYRVVLIDVTERKLAEAALRESRERLALILDSAAEGVYGLDLEGRCTFCNPAALCMLGYREERELLGKNMHDLAHHTRADGVPYPREGCLAARACISGEHLHGDRELLWRSDGGSFPVEFWVHPMCRDGNVVGCVVTFVDRTEHLALESQLRQAQKLEAVGQLAAGLAHDFNNILSAIIGHGHLALLKSAEDDPLRLNVESMMQASYQASRLVQSLLAVGRQQLVSFKPADLNAVVDGALKLQARTLGPGIALKTTLAEQPLPVRVDSGQIEALLQNLAANAAAAMPGGGTLTVATMRIVIDAPFVAARGFGRPGPSALLTVSDTGAGMDEETQRRVFEPFFTTQEFGQGSGLGLAVAYGIVKQHDGFITVASRPGAGTTFSVYLPLLDAAG